MASGIVVLQCSDGTQLKVDRHLAVQSDTIRDMLEALESDKQIAIPLETVDVASMRKIIDFWQHQHLLEVERAANEANKMELDPKDEKDNANDKEEEDDDEDLENWQPPPPPKRPWEMSPTDSFSDWERQYCNVDKSVLFSVMLAANYLCIKDLVTLMGKAIAGLICNKSPQEMRDVLGIVNDFTPEEEEQMIKESEWEENE